MSARATSAVTFSRIPPRRSTSRAATWWGRAWVRAVEEASYSSADLTTARAISRSGRIGQIRVEPGRFVAAVEDEHGLWAVQGTVPVLDPGASDTLVETVAAEAGRVAALLAGDLPHTLVEHAEEAGVELLPYGGELAASCTCDAYLDPCRHALAVLIQTGWLVDADPLVLFAVRGLDREALLSELHDRSTGAAAAPAGVTDLADDIEVAADAVVRARRMVELMESGADLPEGLV